MTHRVGGYLVDGEVVACPGHVLGLHVQVASPRLRTSGYAPQVANPQSILPGADPDEGHSDEQEGEVEELGLDVPLLEDYHSADERDDH